MKIAKLKIKNLIVLLTITTLVAVPVYVSAQAIVPCGYDGAHGQVDANGKPTNLNGVVDANEQCTFNDFVNMAGRIVNGTIIIISVYAAISFMYAGYAYLTSGGNQEKVSYAKQIFFKVFLGYIIILGAWAFVHFIEIGLEANTKSPSDSTDSGTSFLNGGVPANNP